MKSERLTARLIRPRGKRQRPSSIRKAQRAWQPPFRRRAPDGNGLGQAVACRLVGTEEPCVRSCPTVTGIRSSTTRSLAVRVAASAVAAATTNASLEKAASECTGGRRSEWPVLRRQLTRIRTSLFSWLCRSLDVGRRCAARPALHVRWVVRHAEGRLRARRLAAPPPPPSILIKPLPGRSAVCVAGRAQAAERPRKRTRTRKRKERKGLGHGKRASRRLDGHRRGYRSDVRARVLLHFVARSDHFFH